MNFIFAITISLFALIFFSPDVQAAGKNRATQYLSSELPHQLEHEEPMKEYRLLCPICTVNQIDTLFHPCHHITACQECALRINHCPQCRAPVRREGMPISFRFSTGENQDGNESQTEHFQTLCTVCKTHPIDTLYTSCHHLNSCHHCATQMQTCPQCHARITKRLYPVFLSFMPEIRELEQDELSHGLPTRFSSDRELRSRMQKFIQDVKGSADLLAELENQSIHNHSFIRSGREVVVRAQASVIFSLGIEVTLGRYTTSHFCGVPYLRLGLVSGYGALGATASLSSRQYSDCTEEPSPDFTSIINDHDLRTNAAVFGSTFQDLSYNSPGGQVHLEERGIALGGFTSSANRGRTIVRIPIFLPTQRLSKKGRLLLKAKKFELKMLSLIRKGQWAELYQNTLPDYQETVKELLDRVRRKNRVHRSYEALSPEHPFYSLENLSRATLTPSPH